MSKGLETTYFNDADIAPVVYQSVQLNGVSDEMRILQDRLSHDQLTGLYNLDGWTKQVEGLLEQDEPVMVAFLDLDHFKKVNDTLGHEAGDNLLIDFAGALSGSLRSTDIFTHVARASGDEFLVGAQLKQRENSPVLSVEQRAQGFINHISKFREEYLLTHPEVVNNEQIKFNISVGYAHTINGKRTVKELKAEADQRMYEDKDANHKIALDGRNFRLTLSHLL